MLDASDASFAQLADPSAYRREVATLQLRVLALRKTLAVERAAAAGAQGPPRARNPESALGPADVCAYGRDSENRNQPTRTTTDNSRSPKERDATRNNGSSLSPARTEAVDPSLDWTAGLCTVPASRSVSHGATYRATTNQTNHRSQRPTEKSQQVQIRPGAAQATAANTAQEERLREICKREREEMEQKYDAHFNMLLAAVGKTEQSLAQFGASLGHIT